MGTLKEYLFLEFWLSGLRDNSGVVSLRANPQPVQWHLSWSHGDWGLLCGGPKLKSFTAPEISYSDFWVGLGTRSVFPCYNQSVSYQVSLRWYSTIRKDTHHHTFKVSLLFSNNIKRFTILLHNIIFSLCQFLFLWYIKVIWTGETSMNI